MSKKVPSGMFKCDHCKWVYPSYYVNILRTNLPDIGSPALCGICALDLTNLIHGQNRVKFDGESAEYFRVSAEDWRRKHPYDNPTLVGRKRTKDDTTGTGTKQ